MLADNGINYKQELRNWFMNSYPNNKNLQMRTHMLSNFKYETTIFVELEPVLRVNGCSLEHTEQLAAKKYFDQVKAEYFLDINLDVSPK